MVPLPLVGKERMMSSSKREKRVIDSDDDDWIPLDISQLADYSEEKYHKTDKTQPNFELFKALYEAPALTEEDQFRLLYDPKGKDSRKGGSGKNRDAKGPAPSGQGFIEEQAPAETDGISAEDQAVARGFDEGLKKGREEGLVIGMAEGKDAGYAEGYARGLAEAKEQGDAKAKEIIGSLETILSDLEGAWTTAVRQNEADILDLICRIAQRVVYAKVDLDEEIVRDAVLNALAVMPEPREIVLNVSPEDYEYIELIKEEFFETVKTLSSISVVASASVSRGGCIIETATATVRADLEDRLQAVYASLLEAGDE